MSEQHMPEQEAPVTVEKSKKFDFSPSLSILASGVIIAGAILLTHFFPVANTSQGAAAQNNQPTFQQKMDSSTYAQIAKALGADMTKYQSCVDAKTHQAEIDAQSAEAQKVGGQGTPFTVIVDTKTKKQLPVSGALPLEQFQSAISQVNSQGTALSIKAPSATEHIVGSATAPIVLVEYSDFQCPYCKMVHDTLKQLVNNSNGQIAWVYRNFPLYQIHPQAEPAANAAECITEQLGNTAFWKFATTIFES